MSAFDEISLNPITFEMVAVFATLLFLLTCSALISGSEVAYFSLKPADVEDLKSQDSNAAKVALYNLDRPEKLLATVLICNNFVNVAIVILSSYLSLRLIDFGTSTVLKFLFEVVVITSLILFFGEIMPKIYSSQHAPTFAKRMAYPLRFFGKIFSPFSRMLIVSSSIVNDRLAKHQVSNISIDDLSHALEITGDEIREEKDILEGIVKLTNLTAADIMTPRLDVVRLEAGSEFSKVLQVVLDSGYSRIPVSGTNPDDIKGILYVKDLIPYLNEPQDFEWTKLLRDAYYVPDSKMLDDLLSEFQTGKIHMAIVVDEYGGMSGVVTLEDIIEEIVGEISDEFDEDEVMYKEQPDGSILFEGKILLNDFFKIIDEEPEVFEPIRGEAETLAGLLLEIKGLIPAKHEVITYENFRFEIVAADNRRIKTIRFKKEKQTKCTE